MGILIFKPSSSQSPLEALARREFEKAFSFDRGEWTVHKLAHGYRTLREDGPAIHQFSMGGNHYGGGRTTVGGVRGSDLQRNTRFGLTVAYPFPGRHAVKASYSAGAVTESGGDYQMLLLTYLVRL